MSKRYKGNQKQIIVKKSESEGSLATGQALEARREERSEAKDKAQPTLPNEQDVNRTWPNKKIFLISMAVCIIYASLYWKHEGRISALEYSYSDILLRIQTDKSLEDHRIQLLRGFLQTNCDVFYSGKCFRFIQAGERLNFDEAQAMCRRTGWELANMYDSFHYNKIAEYMRGKIPQGKIRISTWLGMTINAKTKQISLSNGQKVSGADLKWYPAYPLPDADHTKMGLVVVTESTNGPEGIHSWSQESDRSGALCEFSFELDDSL